MAKIKEVKSIGSLDVDTEAEKKIKLYLGKPVIYCRLVGSAVGSRLEKYPGIISGFPPASSGFQEKDMAVNITIFGIPGGVADVKQGVMYSKEHTSGRWTENPDIG